MRATMNPRLSLATGLVASLALAAPARAEGQGRAPDDGSASTGHPASSASSSSGPVS